MTWHQKFTSRQLISGALGALGDIPNLAPFFSTHAISLPPPPQAPCHCNGIILRFFIDTPSLPHTEVHDKGVNYVPTIDIFWEGSCNVMNDAPTFEVHHRTHEKRKEKEKEANRYPCWFRLDGRHKQTV